MSLQSSLPRYSCDDACNKSINYAPVAPDAAKLRRLLKTGNRLEPLLPVEKSLSKQSDKRGFSGSVTVKVSVALSIFLCNHLHCVADHCTLWIQRH
jgi:hypothetical protein